MVFPPSLPRLTTETPDGGLLLPSSHEVQLRIDLLNAHITKLRSLKRVVRRMERVDEQEEFEPYDPSKARSVNEL